MVRKVTPQRRIKMAGFIRYERKNNIEYASVYKAKRMNGKKINEIEWLGKVIDKEKGVDQNKKKGVYEYSMEEGIVRYIPTKQEKLILDFGDSYVLHKVLESAGYMGVIQRVFGVKADDISSLIYYKSLQSGANSYAQTWWEGSYSRMLFKDAQLVSQRISETLNELGDEQVQRQFFREYLEYISSQCSGGILLDSTGLPNDIHFPLTAINNHNGVISKESRLILVLDIKSSMPIYFRYAAGNVVDVTTLRTTIAEMREYGIDVSHAIVDAGYYSEKNIKELYGDNISFITRMSTNRKLYKELAEEHRTDLENAKYLVKYRDRVVYIKRVDIDLFGETGYAYVGMDIDRKHDEVKKYINDVFGEGISFEEMNATMQSKGLFILISSEKIEPKDILPLYYTRQAIEQVFDIGKNNADLLPLRVHSIDSFRGHLLLSFMVAAAYIIVNQKLKDSDFCAMGAYRILRNLKCKVFDDKIIVQEATKKMNDIAKHLKLIFPLALNI